MQGPHQGREETQKVLQYCQQLDGFQSELAIGSKLGHPQGFSCESELGFDSVSLLPVACLSYTRMHAQIHTYLSEQKTQQNRASKPWIYKRGKENQSV